MGAETYALTKTPWVGEVVWLGITPHRQRATLETYEVEALQLGFDHVRAGEVQDCHGASTRPACARVAELYPKGVELRNTRQLSILCAQELSALQEALGLPALNPAHLGASIVLSGLPDLSYLPPCARLLSPQGCSLVVELNNLPCRYPALTIAEAHGVTSPDFKRRFKEAAQALRGVTAWVEREGELKRGDQVELFVPTQRPWSPYITSLTALDVED